MSTHNICFPEEIRKMSQYTTKTNKMEYAPSEDSDQPGHPPSLITFHMKKAWVLSYLWSTQQRLIRLGRCQFSLGAHPFCWFCHVLAQISIFLG